jgi:hypothetical protein
VAHGAQQRALIAEAGQITKEAIAPVAKRDGARKKLAQGPLAFDKGEMLISGMAEKMCSPRKLASQIGTVEIACTEVMHTPYRDVSDRKKLRTIFGRSGREPGVENEKVAWVQTQELSTLWWRRIAIRHGREVWIDVWRQRGQSGRQYGRE